MKVLLIAGGWSPERNISLMGAESVRRALLELGHEVTLFTLDENLDALMDAARKHDAAFLNLHGQPGEDGLVQALLDRVGCPYQGSDAAGSFLALHKAAAKAVFRQAGLKTPEGLFLAAMPEEGWEPPFSYPLFAKSNTGGSSLHLSRVNSAAELRPALQEIFESGSEALLETFIPGREVTCGVLGDEALPPILIVPKNAFFDYHDKYAGSEGAAEICPAPLPEDVLRRVQDSALAAHRALGLSCYSRADFIVREDGEIFILEVNTLPGMTDVSLVPKAAAAAGLSYVSLVGRLLEMAVQHRSGKHGD
ncbi:MAG: D-alanine--D-alanine ligase [Desulfovibrionaceae bacterium]|nr:D-alanine--D-alanine ligase [Desulfovibrionaceae bacterium]